MEHYHYEFKVYTSNLKWGRLYLGTAPTRTQANILGRLANKGCYVIERSRVYHNTK